MLKDIKKIFFKKIKIIILFFTLSLISSIIFTVNPFLTGKYIDSLGSSNSIKFCYSIIVVFCLLKLTNTLLTYICQLISLNLKSKISFEITNYFFERLNQVPLKIFQKYDSVYLSQRINMDSSQITDFILDELYTLVLTILNLIIMFSIIINISLSLGVIIFISMLLNLSTYYLFKNKINKSSFIYFEERSNFGKSLNEPFKYSKLIKIHSFQDIFKSRTMDSFKNFLSSLMKYAKISGIYNLLSEIISLILFFTLLFICANKVANDSISIGQVTILLNYFYSASGSISNILNIGKGYQEAKVAYNRMYDLFNIKKEHNGNLKVESIDCIKLCNLNYYDGEKNIINNLNYTFEKGNIYSIIGKNGIGKSTLIYIINKILNKSSGEIFINDINIDLVDMYTIRKNMISFLEQEPILVPDTIFNNVTYGVSDFSKLNQYIDMLNLDFCISKFENGINTYIKDNLENISGGEKQKIGLLRTFLKDSDLIILDEPTSALDKNSCEKLKSYLTSIKSNKIIILVTHDEDINDISDYILDLNYSKENVNFS